MSIADHPIVIIGATGGVGEALARRLKGNNQAVWLVARDAAKLKPLADELGAFSSVVDVTDSEALAAICKEIGAKGPIGGLAYCVGSIVLKPLKAAKDQDFLDAFSLNVVGAANALKGVAPTLIDGASVVFFSTVAVQQGFPNHVVTAAAKGAVEGITRSLAADFAPKVRINCVAPSLLDTPMASFLTKSEAMAKGIAGMHPIPRLGEADDAASLAAFLLSEQAGWITGEVFQVTGGRSSVRIKG